MNALTPFLPQPPTIPKVTNMTTNQRNVVLPGDVVGDSRSVAGLGTKKVGDKLVAIVPGIRQESGERVQILPLRGHYEPRPGDVVVGIVTEANTGNWLVDVSAPWPAPMHVSEVPWRVDFGETTAYLKVGDAIWCKILFVDEQKKVQVTLKDRNLTKLEGGELLEVPVTTVARIIGKNGSMLNLLKGYVECWMSVGQNGRIWLNGTPDEVQLARKAIDAIVAHANEAGLTERISAMLEEARPGGVDADLGITKADAPAIPEGGDDAPSASDEAEPNESKAGDGPTEE